MTAFWLTLGFQCAAIVVIPAGIGAALAYMRQPGSGSDGNIEEGWGG